VLDAIANQQDLNFLWSGTGCGCRWASGRDGTVDAGFTWPEIGIVRAASVELVIVRWNEETMTLANEKSGWDFGGCRCCRWWGRASFDKTILRAGFLGNVVDRRTTALIVGVGHFPADAFADKGDLLDVDWWWGWGRWWFGRNKVNDSSI
jgi:hypothetical protein